MGCGEGDGDCLRSAYYGIAKYGCSFYGLVMPLLPPALTLGNQGAVTYTFNDQGAIAFTYGNQGAITFDYEETQGSGG